MGSNLLSIIDEQKSGGCCSASVTLNVSPPQSKTGAGQFQGRAAMVTLGCAKDQVDSEVMLGVLRNTGFEITQDLSDADVAVVNTCGFLESAVRESVNAILEVADFKQKGRLRKLIVAGCMVSRYKDELSKSMPEVDSFISVDDLLKVGQVAVSDAKGLLEQAARPYFLYDDSMPRHLASKPHTAYVKIGEGCNRPCAFCIIPKIRGTMRSRGLDSVVSEVRQLGAQGVKEINLVAQDLTDYGSDHTPKQSLSDLLMALDATKSIEWIRLLYAYPIGITDELLRTMAQLPRIVKYLDLPLQHSSENVLKMMKRPIGRYAARKIVEFIRTTAPELKLRTTFIVGFPGETEADVEDLANFVAEGHFSSVGVFTYSAEQGTPAYEMEGHVSEKDKRRRRDAVMKAQQGVVEKTLPQMIGQRIPVLIEGPHSESDLLWSGRAAFQAPEVDGEVIINDVAADIAAVAPGQIRSVEITEIAGYDLVGVVVE